MNNKSRQIGIFAGLKILEIGGMILIPYLLFIFGRFWIIYRDLNILDVCGKDLICGFWDCLLAGFMVLIVSPCLILVLIFLIYLVLEFFIKVNWQWSKKINERFT